MRNVERKGKGGKNENKWVFPVPMVIVLKLEKAFEFKKYSYRMLKVIITCNLSANFMLSTVCFG